MSAVGLLAGALVATSVMVPMVRRRPPARLRALARRRSHPDDADRRSRAAAFRQVVVPGVVVAAVAAAWLLHPLLPTAIVLGAIVGRPAFAKRRADRRAEAVRDQLPDVIDLFRSSVDAGLTVAAAIDAVAMRTDGAWRDALWAVRHRIALGERRTVALHELDRLGAAARPLARALIAADRDGAPLTLALDALARDARIERRRAAEEAARRLPVQLLLPLVLCILPAFGLLTVVPVLVGTLQSLAS